MSDRPVKLCPICGAPVKRRRNTYCSYACAGKAKQHYKTCVTCGKPFPSPPTAATLTCSPECSAKHRGHLHNAGVYADAEIARREGAARAPSTARGSEQHHVAREWVIQSPDGQTFRCRNLLEWLRQHEDMLDGTARQAWDGISKIKYSMQGKRKNPSKQWKGWRLREWGE